MTCSAFADPSRWDKIVDGRDANPVRDQHKTFGANRAYGSSSARTKSFSLLRIFQSKSYTSREYYGAKAYSTDQYQGSRQANLSTKYELQGKGKKAPVKTAETKAAREKGKNYASNSYETRAAVPAGKSQDILDAEVVNRKNLSINQVRELLNKNE